MQGLTKQDLEILTKEFAPEQIGVKAQSYSKDRTRVMLVLYAQHTEVYARLEAVDPSWSCEVLAEDPSPESIAIRMRMTVKGVSRENVGEGKDRKGAYSDALKRCAMLFGVGRYLYDSARVWVPYSEQQDKFREWTFADYSAALKRAPAASTAAQAPSRPAARPQPSNSKPPIQPKAQPAQPQLGGSEWNG